MGELRAGEAFQGLLPLKIGGVELREVDLGVLTSVSPFGDAMDGALEQHHGIGLPKPNRATGKDGARCIWFGHRDVLLAGPAPHTDLAQHGAVVDVSDGWVAVSVQGAGGVDVLARLVPVDLRASQFKRGHSARTQVGHMAASITRTGSDTLLVLVFRSMAQTLVHELRHAMEAVAARG